MIFTNLLNKESVVNAEEFALLAEMTNDEPKVVRADCLYDFEACDLMLNHVAGANKTFPVIMMLTPERAHLWNGTLNHKDIVENFVKDHKYKGYRVHGGQQTNTRKLIENGKKFVTIRLAQMKLDSHGPQTPYLIRMFDDSLGQYVAGSIGFTFHTLGLDFWPKHSKIAAFVMIVLLPFVITFYHLMEVCFCNKKKAE